MHQLERASGLCLAIYAITDTNSRYITTNAGYWARGEEIQILVLCI